MILFDVPYKTTRIMKKLLLPFIVLISLTVFGQVPETGLTAEYKFTNGRLDDAIGTNDLTQTGAALVFGDNRAGGPTKAISLNGDYLQRANNGAFAITASYWIKTPTNDPNKRVIIDQTERTSDAESSTLTGWYTYLQNGKIGVGGNFQWYHSNNSAAGATGYVGYQHLVSSASVDDNNWHHVAITMHARSYNWLNSQYQRFERIIECTYVLYVDGVQQGTLAQQKNVGSAPSPAMRRFTNSANMAITIGDIRTGTSTSKYEDGFDDFRYYSQILNPTEVGQLANETACSGTSGVTAVTQDITIALDASGNASIVAADIDNGSNAVCDEPFTLSIDKTTFTCDDLGFNVVTLTAEETFVTQAMSTATATVTVTYVPEVITQNIIVQLDESGNASIVPADMNNGSAITGLCGAALTYSLDKTAFTCAELGVNTVVLTASDGNGNAGTANATVTIEDQVAPTIVAQNINVTVDAAFGFVTIETSDIDNGSTDNCGTGSLTMSLSKTRFTCEDTGDNTVTITVEDTNGNVSIADATVTVTSAINDETIAATNLSMCPDGTSGSTISTGSSVVGFNYTLRNSADNSIIDGPTAGTGNALDFTTGNLSETTIFNVLAEKTLATTQSALDFDGVNDYVSLGTDNRGISSQVTVAAWVKTTASGATQFIASKYVYPLGYYLYIDANGKAGISGRNDTVAGIGSGISTKSVNDGEWHYITGSVNASTGVSSIYVDGVLENTTNNSIGTSIAGSADLLLGLTTALYFRGEMEQVTLWNTALDAAAILANMNSCLSGSETNIVGHFIFEGGSGTTLTDQSSSALNGTLTNMDGATDWVQVVSPSCGDKSCDYQLSTEITIGDAIAPTAVAQDIAAEIDASNGAVTITADMIDNGSTDNCTSSLIKSISKSTFDCSDVGVQTITLTIEDASGNTATVQSIVTVTSPIIDETVTTANPSFCPDGSIATISTGSSVIGIDYYLRNSSNNEIKDGPIAGTGGVLDFSTGNISSTSTFNVYAKLALVAPHSSLDFDGINDKVVTTYAPSATSALTVELWVYPRSAGFSRILSSYQGSSTVLAGEIVLDTYDASANNGQAVRFVVSGAGNVAHFYGVPNVLSLSTWNHVAATFDNGISKIYVNGVLVGTSTAAPFTSLPASSANVTIGEDRIQGPNAEYFDGQMDEIRIWNTARTASEIAADKNSCMIGNESGLELFYNFNENTGLVTTDLVSGNNGTLTNMDAGTDWVTSGVGISCGDVCDLQMTTEITMGDNTPPTAVAQDITIQLDAAGNAIGTVSAVNNGSTDNCTDTNSLVLDLDKTTFDCTDLGANTVTLMVEDQYGNQSTAIATVTIEDTTAPTVISQNIILQLDANGNVDVDPTAVNNGSTDNCTAVGNLVLSLSKTDFTCTDLGVNTITLTVTDGSTNQVSTTATVTIEDRVAPTASAQDITVQLDADGIASILVTDINNGSTDNCTSSSNLTYSLDQTDFACADIGVNVVTLTVLDDSANQSTVTATVTVEDSITPTAIAQDITLVLNGASSISLTPAEINNGSSDICGVTLSLDITTFTDAQIGDHTVTLTVEDPSGNISTATATVTVTDKQVQTITFEMIADKTFGDESFEITASASTQLPVVFSIVSGPVTLSDGIVSITGAGDVTIRASQAGDATFASAQLDRTFNIEKANQVLTIEPIAEKTVVAAPITISASVDTNLGLDYTISGPATIANGVVTLNGTIGTVGVTVTQPGNDNYNPISQNINFNVVNQTAQTLVFSSLDDKTYGDDEFNLTASSDSELAVSLAVISGPVTLSGSTLSITGTGEVIVEATQEGDVTFLGAAAVRQQFMVNKAMLTATAEDISITYGTAVPELIFGYVGFVNGESASVLSVEPTISTTVASDVNGANAGTYVITLDGGQADNYLITLVNGTLDIAKADQQITASPIDTKLISDTDFDVVASVDTGLELIYEIAGPASISGTTVSLDGDVGVVTITITQLGNINYNETSETLNFDVAVPAGIANDLLEIKIFPNPSTSYIQIETPKTENLRAIMFDLNGSLLWSKPISSINNQFDVSSLKVGAYILKIQSEDHSTTTTTKILIER
ncbi:MAG: hypothetical protein ACJA2S_002363 [Cyclobacteriaceae bacterium]|jgi:hypothetical protein